ncbi:MAG: hypothetical protein IKT19_01640 [Paludibacteraceae bacterium]|nr:hypothetical protein [Paludibacteraceae bacterium]
MRNRSMDMMKGIAILLVVFLHNAPVPFNGVVWDWLGQGVYLLQDVAVTEQFYKSVWFIPSNVDFWTLIFFELTLCVICQRGFDYLRALIPSRK